MKKLISLTLALVMLITTFSVTASAVDEPFASGVAYAIDGFPVYWELSEDGGTLTINGRGHMGEFEFAPEWLDYNFTKLVVGEGLKDIGQYAFLNAENLESVELASTVDIICPSAFYGCENLKEVDYKNAFYIGPMAFYGCESYTDIEIPDTMREIDEYALGYYCDEVLDIELSKIPDVKILGSSGSAAQKYAEQNDIRFIDVNDFSSFFTYCHIGDTEISLESYTDNPYSDEVIIPSQIKGYKVIELERFLFENSNVKTVYIPATVEEISPAAFTGAPNLTDIICEEGGHFTSIDGVLYGDNCRELVKVPEAKTEINQLPENLKVIGGDSFRNSKVKTLEVPETVERFSGSVFTFSDIETITLSDNIKEIPETCFYGCENLKEIKLPKNLEQIEENAFSNCPSLTEIELPTGLYRIDGAAFHCTGIKSVIIPDTVRIISDHAFGYYSADDIEFVKDEDFEIFGKSGTEAEEYANDNGFRFTDITPEQPSITDAYTDKVGITLFWEKTDDAQSYEIYRKYDDREFKKIAEVGIDEEAVYCDLDVYAPYVYTYAVVAVKDNIRSSFDKTVELEYTNLKTPELVSAELTAKGINVKWKTVSGGEGYILYRKTENTDWEEIADLKGKVKSYEDTSVKSGETYSYTVKAYSGVNESGCDYDGVSSLYLSIPKLKTATNATKGIKITWSKVKGANGYIIGRKTKSTSWTKIAETDNVDNYIDKTAKSGTTYTYTVVPVSDDVKGFYSEKGITCKRLSKVITESATNTDYGVKIEWKPISSCSGYRIYRKTEKGSYKRIATVKGSTRSYYTDENAKSGTKYTYKVVAYSGSYTSYYTEVSRYYLDNPKLSSVKSSKKGITAKWGTVKGASGYYVYRKTADGSYKKIATVKGQSKKTYLDKSAKKGRTYTYKVKAYYSKTTSAYSNAKKIKDKY